MKKKAKKQVAKVAKEESKVKFRPSGDRVLVKPLDAEDEKSPSGIIIPDTARKEKSERGVIVAVGPGKRGDDNEIIPVAFRVGDVVMFDKYGYAEVEIEDEEYYVVSESNILGIF